VKQLKQGKRQGLQGESLKKQALLLMQLVLNKPESGKKMRQVPITGMNMMWSLTKN
jgi:hypothetical protein